MRVRWTQQSSKITLSMERTSTSKLTTLKRWMCEMAVEWWVVFIEYLHTGLRTSYFYYLYIYLYIYLDQTCLFAFYLDTRECWRCHQHLPIIDFASSTTCRTCSRRHRSALNNSLHEVSLSTEPVSRSYDEFVSTHLTDIEDVLREAINTHR